MASKEYHREHSRKAKMAKLNKKRFCKQCGKEIDNSKRKIYKRTKYCSIDCVDDYQFDKRERKQNEESRKLKQPRQTRTQKR